MNPTRPVGNVPWLTPDGYFDPAKFPIDGVLKQAISNDPSEFRSGLNLLRCMWAHGRQEAGVFLLGLLLSCDDTWDRRIAIVEALTAVETKPCADLLFSELRRVRSSNSTRRYLGAVLKALADMPPELVRDGFAELAADPSFSAKMRAKFKAVLNKGPFGDFDPF
jgi:hypothetical protein